MRSYDLQQMLRCAIAMSLRATTRSKASGISAGRTGGRSGWAPGYTGGAGPVHPPARNSTDYQRELVVGQWGVIPWFAKSPKLTFSATNARSESEELAAIGQVQGSLESRPALHHPRGQLRRAELGEREEPVVEVPARRRGPVGPGRPVEHLDRQGNGRGALELHDAHLETPTTTR